MKYSALFLLGALISLKCAYIALAKGLAENALWGGAMFGVMWMAGISIIIIEKTRK